MPSAGIVAVLVGVALGAVLYYFIGNSEEEQPAHNSGRRSNGGYNNRPAITDSAQWDRHSTIQNRIRYGNCSICLESLTTAARVVLEPCNHIFHKKCIMEWQNTANQKSCPNCRSTFM